MPPASRASPATPGIQALKPVLASGTERVAFGACAGAAGALLPEPLWAGFDGAVLLPPPLDPLDPLDPPPSGSWYWLSPALWASADDAGSATESATNSIRTSIGLRRVTAATLYRAPPMETATSRDFPAALAAVSGVEGWLTDAQARRLWDAARTVPAGGSVVEIGSYRGRSTVVLARATEAPV